MLALTLDDELRCIGNRPEPRRARGEALISMLAAGVCDTDLQLARGYMGFRGVPGHEFVGRVLDADDASWIGRRVVADINAGCGACDECRERGGHHCERRTVLGIAGRDGAFAERFTVPERCLVAVPSSVGDETAVFAEPLAAALHVLDAHETMRSEPVLVLGDGKLGLLTAMALRGSGVPVTLVGHHENKLAIAKGAGVSTILEKDLDQSHRAPFVVEATGNPRGIERALSLTRPRGTVVLKTTVADPAAVDLSPIVIHELSVVGSRCGDMALAIDILARRQVDPTSLIEARYPLSEGVLAFEHAARRGALKVLVQAPESGR